MRRRRFAGNRVGLTYLVLAISGAACALALSAYYHLSTAAAAVSMLPSTAGLYLSWAAYRADRSDVASGRDLATIADDLAQAVDRQWREEARLRRLNDPYPLPISWSPAPEGLVEAWPLVSAAAREWPGGPPGRPAEWADTPGDLAAQWAQIVEVFHGRVPTRRLVVLGEPGSGKTMLLIRLAQGLLAERTAGTGSAVPVIFSLASWNPAGQDLFAWMTACLERDYLGLEQQAPAPDDRVSRARALLDSHLILPVLDGFDEMPPDLRPVALDAINQALRPRQGLVLSSRTGEFRGAVSAPGAVSVKLTGAAGIELRPLDAQTSAAYLLRDAGGDDAAERRWEPVIRRLGTSSPVGSTLRTPLMLFLARTIYNPRPGERRGAGLPDPAALCDAAALPDRQAVEQHLLSSFVPACYRPSPADRRTDWDTETAQRTLGFLAEHLENAVGGSPDLAWWQLARSVPMRRLSVALWFSTVTVVLAPITGLSGLLSGIAYGVVKVLTGGTWSSLEFGVVAGTLGGVVGGVVFAAVTSVKAVIKAPFSGTGRAWLGGRAPLTRMRWAWNGGLTSLTSLVMLVTGVIAWFGFGSTVEFTIAAPLTVAVVVWNGLHGDPAHITQAGGPGSLLAQERRTILVGASVLGPISAATVSTVFAIWGGFTPALGAAVVVGISVGVAIGLVVGAVSRFNQLAWFSFVTARWYFALRHDLPRDLMAFLGDAHQHRGVLRQVAGIYQFRHLDLQRCLAAGNRDVSQPS